MIASNIVIWFKYIYTSTLRVVKYWWFIKIAPTMKVALTQHYAINCRVFLVLTKNKLCSFLSLYHFVAILKIRVLISNTCPEQSIHLICTWLYKCKSTTVVRWRQIKRDQWKASPCGQNDQWAKSSTFTNRKCIFCTLQVHEEL